MPAPSNKYKTTDKDLERHFGTTIIWSVLILLSTVFLSSISNFELAGSPIFWRRFQVDRVHGEAKKQKNLHLPIYMYLHLLGLISARTKLGDLNLFS